MVFSPFYDLNLYKHFFGGSGWVSGSWGGREESEGEKEGLYIGDLSKCNYYPPINIRSKRFSQVYPKKQIFDQNFLSIV